MNIVNHTPHDAVFSSTVYISWSLARSIAFFLYICIASKIWSVFSGPFGPFGPFLHRMCDAVRRTLRHVLHLIGPNGPVGPNGPKKDRKIAQILLAIEL